MKAGKYYIFCISIIKSLKSFTKQKFNQVIEIKEENMFAIRDQNMLMRIKYIIKSNESLAENKFKK